MECRDYRELFPLLIKDGVDQTKRNEIESHLETCMDCRKEFEELLKLWDLMGEVPEPIPSAALNTGFNAILSNFKEEFNYNHHPVDILIRQVRESWHKYIQPRLVYSLLFIAAGVVGGYLLHKPADPAISYNRQIDSLSVQVSEMKQVLMLSLLQNPSASQRIRAVGYTEEISNVDLKVIDALLATLNEDPNVNVRLATLEALVRFSARPEVREGLVRSINNQESPLMQSAIADVMVRLQEKSAVPSLQKLLTKKDLNLMVKLNIQKNISKLI
jgi:hypothetical protein